MKLNKLTEEILHDLAPCLLEGWALTGSGAYSLLLPALADKVIKDVDIIVYPIQNSNDLVGRKITDKFYITRLFITKRGFQFSLVHKRIGCWIDIFPRKQTPKFVEVNTNYAPKTKVHIIEEIVYGLCVGTLEKTYGKKSVLKDSIDKLKKLVPHVNLTLFDQIVNENIDQTIYMTSALNSSINTRGIIQYVINNCQPYTPPGYKFENYPIDQSTTPNGLKIADPLTYSRAMKQHLKYLENFNRAELDVTK